METSKKYRVDRPTLILGLASGFIFIGYLDPINWPKQILLISVVPYLIYLSWNREVKSDSINNLLRVGLICISSSATLSAILSITLGSSDKTRILWGTWGRNNGLLTLLSLFSLAWCFARFAQDLGFLRNFLHSVELVTLVFSSYALFQFFGLDPVSWSKQNEVFSFFGNTNFASAVFALSASTFLILLFFESRSWFYKSYRFLFLSVSVFLAYQTNSIQGLAGFFIVFLLVLFIRFMPKTLLSKASLFGGLSGVGIFVFLGTTGVGPLSTFIEQYTVQLRVQYWLTGIRIGNSSPIWGVGVDSYGDYFRTLRSEELAKQTSIDLITNNAHNVFVQYYATMGILGLFSVLVPVLVVSVISFRILLSDSISTLQRSAAALFLALWSMAFFSIDNIAIAIWNWSILGVVMGIWLSREEALSGSTQRPSGYSKINADQVDVRKGISIALCASLFAFGWFSSYPDRTINKFLSLPVNPSFSDERVTRIRDIKDIANSPFLMETHYWYLAGELNRIGAENESIALLDSALKHYPKDFNLLDLSAAFRERLGLQVEAINFRKQQIEIEGRHPRIWLSYAYDLLAAGRLEDSQEAFRKVLEHRHFLAEEILNQLPDLAKQFDIEYSG